MVTKGDTRTLQRWHPHPPDRPKKRQGKHDFAALFKHYDRDNSGELDFDEFRRAVRKDGKLTEEVVADADLEKMFAAVDTDGGGSIGLDEFEELLGASGPSQVM